jgi:uncharacterized protein YdeI (YjbR/CyaY-like superfamily)
MANTGKQVQVESRQEWRKWLEENHNSSDGIWLITFKKHCKDKYVSKDDMVEEAICFGWIDSLPRKLDQDRTMLWMAPRKSGSGWSRLNKERVSKMIASGGMTPAGLEKVVAAKQDGSWKALDAVEALEIPADLEAAFGSYSNAKTHFDAFHAR